MPERELNAHAKGCRCMPCQFGRMGFETRQANQITAHPRMTIARRDESRAAVSCPLCVRENLPHMTAFWQHMAMAHSLGEIAERLDARATVLPDAIEDVLVRIVNSASHEAAIEIATAFLMGE